MDKEKPTEVQFTPTQAEYFLTDIKCFYVYWYLVYERKSVGEIESTLRMSKRDVQKYLHKLDKIKLIEVLPQDRVKVPRVRLVKWSLNDPFSKKLFNDWALDLVREALSKNDDNSKQISLKLYQLRPDSIVELTNILKSVDEEFSRRTVREMNLYKGDLTPVRVAMIQALGSFVSST